MNDDTLREKPRWKPIDGYVGLYDVSDTGLVYSHKSGRPMKAYVSRGGYLRVGLSRDGKSTRYLVHRLVATAYVDNPDRKPIVNHKDNDPSHNWSSNLEWCTPLENTAHMIVQGRKRNGRSTKGIIRATSCRSGHPLSGDNLYTRQLKNGAVERKCRTCNRLRSRRIYAEQRTLNNEKKGKL